MNDAKDPYELQLDWIDQLEWDKERHPPAPSLSFQSLKLQGMEDAFYKGRTPSLAMEAAVKAIQIRKEK